MTTDRGHGLEARTLFRRIQFRRIAATVLSAAILVGVGWWAGRQTVSGTSVAQPLTARHLTVRARLGSVGQTLAVTVQAQTPTRSVAVNELAGTLTWVRPQSLLPSDGAVVYRVDGIPVVAVQGSTPFYRTLRQGVAGPDVATLARALHRMGFLAGAATTDRFDAVFASAVRRWQAALGVRASGVLALGDLIAVPRLPAQLSLDGSFSLGSRVQPGVGVIAAGSGGPELTLTTSTGQAEVLRSGMPATVTYRGFAWPAVLGAQSADVSGDVVYAVDAPGRGSVCGTDCRKIPGRFTASATVQVVVRQHGVVVPDAAVYQGPTGMPYVLLSDGRRRAIRERASANGIAVVTNVPAGTRLRVGGGGS